METDDADHACGVLEGSKDSNEAVCMLFCVLRICGVWSWEVKCQCDQQESITAKVKLLLYRDI